MVLKTTGLSSRFQRKNRYYAPGTELLAKMSKNMQVWFGNLIFGMFCLISRDPLHIFKKLYITGISALFQPYLGRISALSLVIFHLCLICFSAVSQPYLSHISAVSQLYLSRISAVSQQYLSRI